MKKNGNVGLPVCASVESESNQTRASKIMLNGVSVARRKRVKPAALAGLGTQSQPDLLR
jgi:hypothetical protein